MDLVVPHAVDVVSGTVVSNTDVVFSTGVLDSKLDFNMSYNENVHV